ncbi:MAG: transcription antitermination factor NusB [Gammaproteobacteria bacterium]|nr:transcription antitermination factor NusB [Gammaproteobacteria bacterium]
MSPKARHKARSFAMQAIYQWSHTGDTLSQIEAQYLVANAHHKVDWEFFKGLLHGVPANLTEIDEHISTASSDRSVKEINPVELAILRLAIFEFMHRIDVPYKVVINEYVDLGHTFGAEEGHKYVNGVLDKVAKQTRQTETR